MGNNVIIFPGLLELQSEVESLRSEISTIILERDHLLYVECVNIETQYMLELGMFEYKAYELQCAILRLKRKIEMIQTKINRQEKVILPRIESELDKEFEEYQKKLEEYMDKVNNALERSRLELLSSDEVKELTKLYRTIVKLLHPDLHMDITEVQLRLFNNAVVAYKNGDIESLRVIHTMIAEPVLVENEDVLSFLVREQKRLVSVIVDLRASIDRIKSVYPYTMKDFVASKESIRAKSTEFEEIIAGLNEMVDFYKQRVNEMLES